MNYEWDDKKNLINIKKHKISFELAAYVFSDPLRKETYDDMHSDAEEDRLVAIGIAKEILL